MDFDDEQSKSTLVTPTRGLPQRITALNLSASTGYPISMDMDERVRTDAHVGITGVLPTERFPNGEAALLLSNFFGNVSLERLKNVCEAWKLKRTAPKDVLIARCTLFVVNSSTPGTTTDELRAFMLNNPACDGFSVFCKARSRKWVEVVPDIIELQAVEEGYKTGLGAAANTSGGKTPASTTEKDSAGDKKMAWELYETARLMVLLRDTEGRDALRTTRRKIQVAELDAGIGRFAPWSDVTARIYNNRDYAPKQPLDGYGHLAEVDCSQLPPETRTGGRLRAEFNNLRPKFSTCYKNWTKSGHLEVDNFIDYVRNEKNDLTSSSLHLMVIFEVIRCGRKEQDDDLLDLVLKTIDEEEINGYEGGLDDVERAIEEAPSIDTPSLPSTFGSRKRKREMRQEDLMMQQIKLQSESVQTQKQFATIATGLVDVFRQQVSSGMSPRLQRNKEMVEHYKMLKEASKDLKVAQEMTAFTRTGFGGVGSQSRLSALQVKLAYCVLDLHKNSVSLSLIMALSTSMKRDSVSRAVVPGSSPDLENLVVVINSGSGSKRRWETRPVRPHFL